MRNNIFTVHAKEQYPASEMLRRDADDLARRAAYAPSREILDEYVGDNLVELIGSIRRIAPRIGRELPGRHGPGGDRDVGRGTRVPTTRLRYQIEVLGDDEVLTWWPDENDDGLRALNQDLIDEIGDPRTCSDADAKRYFASIDTWTVDTYQDPDGAPIVVLTTWVDLTAGELAEPDQQQAAADLFRQRRAALDAILDAMSEEMKRFYDEELPELLHERAVARRAHIDNIETVYRTIGLPETWAMAAPTALEVDDPPTLKLEGFGELPVPIRWRLEPTSYANILRTIRAWADKVEDHPDAFSPLIEDRISDLLCATLHATTSGAGREVFSRGGKTDIRIQASALDEGNGPASIFVLESKWVAGKEDVESAIEDQLMRYIPVAASSTVFLALSRNADSGRAVESTRGWARDVPGYVSERLGEVEGWPIFTYEIPELGGLLMDVCIATVALPPVPRTRAEKKADGEAQPALVPAVGAVTDTT